MLTFLPRTLLAIEECEQHLRTTNSIGTSVESYLTQHILVVMCAEIQQEIYSIVNQRASKNADLQLAKFVSAVQDRVLKSVKTSEIAGFLGYFESSYKEVLRKSLSEQDVSVYDNAVVNRHDIAHRHGANVSFDELKKAGSIATKILEVINATLNPV